jgi:transcriptional regulator with XRE-family HTH domain
MLTVRALAAAAGCSPTTVHEVEAGKRVPRFDTIQRLSAALEVEPTQIVEFRQALLMDGEHA